MKKYFLKWIDDQDNDLRTGDSFYGVYSIGVKGKKEIYRDFRYSGMIMDMNDFQKARLMVCSREPLQPGDTITDKTGKIFTYTDDITKIPYINELVFKVIGEVSPVALPFLDEGMEFDDGDIRVVYACEKGNECDINFGEQLCSAPHEIKLPILFKCSMGCFH